jgi:hypothetical protein
VTYSLQDSRVLCDGRDTLTLEEVGVVVRNALRRKLRQSRRAESFLRNLAEYRDANITWNFTHRITKDNDNHVSFLAWQVSDNEYRIYCVGPWAKVAIERVNRLREGYVVSRKKSRGIHVTSGNLKTATARRRKKNCQKRKERQIAPKQQKKKRAKVYVPAVLSLENHQILTPQFRNNRVLWDEAVSMTIQSFDVQANWKYTAREIVSQELFASLERSGYRFAQFKRAGFCLRFDLIDGLWRGDLTPLTVACTKDNTHRSYRRMRKWLRDKLLGLPSPEQAIRRAIVYGKVAA